MEIKVNVSDVSKTDLAKLYNANLKRAKEIFQSRPFVTKTWFKMNTTFSHIFIDKNWNKITELK